MSIDKLLLNRNDLELIGLNHRSAYLRHVSDAIARPSEDSCLDASFL